MKAVYRLFYYLSIGLTLVLAGFTLAGAFAGQVALEKSELFPFLGLAMPVLLLANVAVGIYWLFRWRCWVWIPVVAILGNGGYLARVFQFPLFERASEPAVEIASEGSPANSQILSVATYNANSFNRDQTGYSCKHIARHLKELEVDVICFQEFGVTREFPLDSVKAALAEWQYHYIPQAPQDAPILQTAIFSRFPIAEKQLISYPESRNNSSWCDLDIKGRIIRVFNNHLQTTEVSRNKRKLEKKLVSDDTEGSKQAFLTLAEGLQENFRKRAAQAEQMNKLINASPYPSLVCGDFNSLPSSYIYRLMKGDKLKDGFQTCGHGYMYTFLYFKHLLRIDYIFHSPELEGVDYFSPDWDYSDHKPVVMRVRV